MIALDPGQSGIEGKHKRFNAYIIYKEGCEWRNERSAERFAAEC